MREHDVASLTAGELEQTKRDLAASLALVRPDSPVRVPILAQMTAIDAELAGRSVSVRVCSCGFATDDRHGWTGTCSSTQGITSGASLGLHRYVEIPAYGGLSARRAGASSHPGPAP